VLIFRLYGSTKNASTPIMMINVDIRALITVKDLTFFLKNQAEPYKNNGTYIKRPKHSKRMIPKMLNRANGIARNKSIMI